MSINLGLTLADLRKRNGYSQEALAEKMGISRQAVSKWERGESTPDTDTLIELAKLYSISLDYLVGNTKPAEKEKNHHFHRKTDKTEKTKSDALYPGLSKKLLLFPFPVVITAVYIFSGFALKLWHPMWLIFLLIPAYYHFAVAARAKTKKGLLLGLPVIEIAIILFLILGLFMNAWKWAWILFIAAICYYWAIASYVKKEN